jgi:hypothetical protein
MRAWIVLGALAACSEHGTTPGDAGDGRVTVLEVPVTPNLDVDLLFLVDDSPSIAFQDPLRASLASLFDVLNTVPGGLPNLHIGVITSDMGTSTSTSAPAPAIGQIGNGGCASTGKNGVLQVGAAPVSGAFISDTRLSDGTRQQNYTGALVDVLTQMTQVGAGGCGFEQPLHAVRAALDNNPANAGFLRPDALLGVVLVTDEDDCSVKDPSLFSSDTTTLGPLQSFRCTRFGVTCSDGGTTPDEMNLVGPKSGCGPNPTSAIIDDVAPFHDFLLALKADPRDVLVSGILGPPVPVAVELRAPPGGGTAVSALAHTCIVTIPSGAGLAADPGVRLKAFLELFGDRGTFVDGCQSTFSQGLRTIARPLASASGSPCIDAPLGPFPDCVVEDVVGTTITPIPPCGSATCWHIEEDAITCSAQRFKLVVERAVPANPATITRLRCKPVVTAP